LVAAGSGDAHKLFWSNEYDETGWRFINKSIPSGSSHIANDYRGNQLGMYYEDGNGGNVVVITPVPLPFDFTIEATAEASATAYNPAFFGDIIFKSTDASTGQLKDIPTEGLQVNGVVKIEKTFAFDKTYSIGFPFAIASVSNEAYILESYNGTINQFEDASEIEAGAGYLIQFQTPEETEEATTNVTFTSATNPTLYNASNTSVPSGYSLVANPLVINLTELIDGAAAFYVYNFAEQTFALVEEAYSLKPFEALVAVKDVDEPLYDDIGNGFPINLENIDASDPIVDIKYYTLQGIELQQLSENGVYIVKKIYASQKAEVVKVLFKK
jgi:hypothetical protein